MSHQPSGHGSPESSKPNCYECIYAPVNGFLVYLAKGWEFSDLVVEPIEGFHGHWSMILTRR